MNKYEALATWVKDNYESVNGWIFFNASTMEDGNSSIQTMESERAEAIYNDGSTEVAFLFAIALIRSYDTEMSALNTDAMAEADNFADWIEAQNELDNLPVLGDNEVVNSVEVLDSVPSVAVDAEQNLAKIQFNCRLNFLRRSKNA